MASHRWAPGGNGSALAKLLPTSCWLLGTLWVFGPQLASSLQLMIGLPRDPRLVNYTLEHGYRWLMRYPLHSDFWQTPLFYPYANATAFTDLLIGLGPLYWVWRWLGAEPDSAFQLWILVCWSLNFWVAYLLLRRGLEVGRVPASLGATLVAFSSAQLTRLYHPQLIPLFLVLLGTFALLRIFSDRPDVRRRSWVLALSVSIVLQAYTAFYPFFFFGLLLALALAWALTLREGRLRLFAFLRSDGMFAGGCVLIAVVLITPLVLRYLGVAEELGLRPFMTKYAPRPASWFLLGEGNYLFGWLQREGGPFAHLSEMEHSAGIGFIAPLVGLCGLLGARRRPGMAILLLATGSLMLIATMFGDFSVWRWVHAHVPGAGGIRAIARVSMILTLAVPIGIALLLERLWRSGSYALCAALALLCVIEQPGTPLLHVSKLANRQKIEKLAERVGDHCAAFLLVYRGPPGHLLEDDYAAWVQLATHKPTVNGRYGNVPKDWKLFRFQSDGAIPDRRQLRLALNDWLERYAVDPRSVCWVEYG